MSVVCVGQNVATTGQEAGTSASCLTYLHAPRAKKRRVANEARTHCKTPILELYNGQPPELVEEIRTCHHESKTPEDFFGELLKPSSGLKSDPFALRNGRNGAATVSTSHHALKTFGTKFVPFGNLVLDS